MAAEGRGRVGYIGLVGWVRGERESEQEGRMWREIYTTMDGSNRRLQADAAPGRRKGRALGIR